MGADYGANADELKPGEAAAIGMSDERLARAASNAVSAAVIR